MFDPLNMSLMDPRAMSYAGGGGGYYSPQQPMYQPNTYAPPPPPQPAPTGRQGQDGNDTEMSNINDPLSLLGGKMNATQTHPSNDKANRERRTYDVDKLDADYFPRVKGFHEVVSSNEALVGVVLQVLVLFNSVTTTMIVVSGFRQRVNPYNNPSFDGLSYFMTFFPLVYLLLLVPVFNNYYSERVFYFLLERGAVLNFSNQFTSLRYLVSSLIPGLFFYSFVFYVIVSVVVFLLFGGTSGEILIFVNNAGLGFGLYWYRLQSIEDRLVTMPSFVEHFSNFDGQASDIDLTSFNWASDYMKSAVVVQANDPTYSGALRQWYCDAMHFGTLKKLMIHFMHFVVVIVAVGLAFGYFFYMDNQAVKTRWETTLSPCVTSCASGAANASGLVLGSNSSTVSAKLCRFCVCSCYLTLKRRDTKTMDGCGSYFQPGILASQTVCPSSSDSCPTTCTWFPGWND